MSVTQFAMVEELAFLIRDNIPCKHLVLSMEETLVNFLHDGTSLDGVLELEPMNPYNRLLIHRLAEIFGFSHKSIGEGEDRHLILERCPETSIPSILVSDLLFQSDEVQSPMILDVFKRKDVIQGQRDYAVTESSLEERKTAYLAARERIFSEDASEVRLEKHRPRHDPVVARRMITHALGQTNKGTNHENTKEYEYAKKDMKIQLPESEAGIFDSSSQLEIKMLSVKHPRSKMASEVEKSRGCNISDEMSKVCLQRNKHVQTEAVSVIEKREKLTQETNLRKEHVGTAKRLFASALGIHRKDIHPSRREETKKTDC